MRKIVKMLVIVIAVAVLWGTNEFLVKAANVKLNKKSVTLEIGQTYTLKLKNNKAKVKWTSSDNRVVTVNKKGKIVAQAAGTAKICAKVGKKKYFCKIKVDFDTVTLINGNIATLDIVIPSTRTVQWISSDEKVAKVEDGVVISKGVGTAIITASVGEANYIANIIVKEKPEKKAPEIVSGTWMTHFKVDYIIDTTDGVLVKATNIGVSTLNSVFGYVSYTDEMGEDILCKYQQQVQGVAPNESFYMTFSHPYGDYQSLKCTFSYNDIFASMISMKSSIFSKDQWFDSEGKIYKSGITISNLSNENLDFELLALYKYKGNIVGYQKKTIEGAAGGTTTEYQIEGSDALIYDDVEIVVNNCSKYLMPY